VDAKYHVDQVVGPDADDEIRSALEQLAREGARQMLEWALEAEVEEFLGRERYARSTEFRGYRNGFQRPREVVMGAWSVPVRAPRVSDVPEGCSGFESEILPKKQRLTHDTQLLFAQLYLEGLSSGDFEPVFRKLLGETAPLSANTILRLKERWGEEYEAWRQRRLDHARFVYVWADGIYLGAGLEKQNSCLLTLLGARPDGTKELLAMEIGYRESKDSWADVLRSLRDRGLSEPLAFIADGNLGIWAALTDVFPTARRQRCWNHRLMNVMDKVPRRLQRMVRSRLYQLYTAPTQKECEASRDELAEWLREHAQVAAAETLLRDWDDFVTFYDFPTPHWFHIRTTDEIVKPYLWVYPPSGRGRPPRRRAEDGDVTSAARPASGLRVASPLGRPRPLRPSVTARGRKRSFQLSVSLRYSTSAAAGRARSRSLAAALSQ